ncbi:MULTISPECIES: LysR family transcriptional regulator [unclassified Neisseria]|uniref:LysR family transcriptional regulator n=1 Tax=unclassified Neisseria TaxID=2623750 RepID=UPI002666CDD6|nr:MULTISPECIES: LysR family transcriptional regulator [unclassified Neisseria]MDO1509070.1 LysR family transcriptional regulator [Neisseria sp. MVDL19-042950]MDO1515329.1 LysR family transcriptional regulator [Neisseria sp. MVDL18-041461]MDO1562689.1 LysR family transcriptional regulator [Neisseria sp. MVDL20-010259]
MDTLFSLKVFRQVVENGSFTRAAEHLGISNAMASKHVNHLESTLQAKLLHRNSRNLHLTETGKEYYRQCCHALETLETAAQKAAGVTEKPQGILRITMPQWFANPRISRWISEYTQRYPEVALDLVLSNRHTDLIADGFDLALRVSNDPNPSLIVKPLADIEFLLLASPDYLRRNGVPQTPEEVARHLAILPSYTNISRIEIQHKHSGEQSLLELTSTVYSDNTLMIGSLIRAGAGIGFQPEWCACEDLIAGRVVRLLPDYRFLTAKLYAAYVDRAFLSAKVRSFIDFLSEKVKE